MLMVGSPLNPSTAAFPRMRAKGQNGCGPQKRNEAVGQSERMDRGTAV